VVTAGAGDAPLLRLHGQPPYLRAACLPFVRLDQPVSFPGLGEVSLARARGSLPAYLAIWDRTTQLRVPPGTTAQDVTDSFEEWLRTGGLRRCAFDLFVLLTLMSAWDELIRDFGLMAGRVYFASERAVGRLFAVAGADRSTPEQIEGLLLEAQSLELIYRFPVAYKFRGAYGAENQCRLNGWGRRLARRAVADQVSAELAAAGRETLRVHLATHRQAYQEHLDHVSSQGPATAPVDSWERSASLPVPLLI
jgi:hypothetical protein